MYAKIRHILLFQFALLAVICAQALADDLVQLAGEQRHLVNQRFFMVGGQYVGEKGKEVMRGQIYVEAYRPEKIKHPYPLVFIHGAGQTSANWLGTPDGRQGWADYFVEQGYLVYLLDQPARGRSAYHPQFDGNLRFYTAAQMEKLFTASAIKGGDWPQAKKHSQWPGEGPNKGQRGDPIFDAFYATQVESVASNEETQKMVQKAGGALLDKIGPAILVTHSQSGPFGWLIADIRPNKVKGIIAIEPSGPPFQNTSTGRSKSLPWGLADIPLTYDPPVKDPSEIEIVEVKSDSADLISGWLQKKPARQLPNLKSIPILIITAEASFHAPYDHWTAKYLEQAGVKNTYIRLADQGIHGNGHMVMIEKNNIEIAAFLRKWLERNIENNFAE
jgi:pimeloyl-ACP methyl ester carboxylesterase